MLVMDAKQLAVEYRDGPLECDLAVVIAIAR
jgi:hypothetical protein